MTAKFIYYSEITDKNKKTVKLADELGKLKN